MKNYLLVLLLGVSSLGARAENMQLLPVGKFGGFRLKGSCHFGDTEKLCTLDTMGAVSVIPQAPEFAHYPVVGTENVGGIGLEFRCDIVSVKDLFLLGERPVALFPLRCPSNHPDFPLIGIDFFEGKSFRFDFSSADFSWSTDLAQKAKLIRLGEDEQWIAVPAKLGTESLLLAFDTGNPVTIVSQTYADAHPKLFRPSKKLISPELQAKGLRAYEITNPFLVQGVELDAPYVYVGEFPLFQSAEAPVILGMNHMHPHRWSFDLRRDEFSLTK